jgi:2-polyprenyl-6-methoxyphenol hydroxylase-like FAD-dependent oxidoreductase
MQSPENVANKTQVLIIGAGPTGLMAACQLAMRKISMRIIEQESGPTEQSRALAIQARSLEIFEQMGIIEEFLAQGHPAKAVNLLVDGKPQARLDMRNISGSQTKYPYLLMHEQSKTEKVLMKFLETLGVHVEWNTSLKSFAQDESGVRAVVQSSAPGENSSEQITIKADYLIGADGARSIVRQQLGLTYEGKTYQQDFFVLDCNLSNWDIANDELYFCLSHNSFVGFFPIHPSEYRVIGTMPHAKKSPAINFEDVYPEFLQGMNIPATLSNPKWISEYHSHHRCVNKFRVGSCFVAGDAAHIHSPVGAQGMNTGLQDAVNLSWKLALVLQGRAKEDLLNSYHYERYQVASKLVHTVDQVFSLIVSSNRFVHFVRNNILPTVLRNIFNKKNFREELFKIVSETGISYADSILSKNNQGSFAQDSPKAGDRVNYNAEIEKYLDHMKTQLFLFGNTESNRALTEQLNIHWQTIIDIHVLEPKPDSKNIYELFGLDFDCVQTAYLIRPDRHVAYRGSANLIDIQNYLTIQMDLIPA